MSKKLIVVINNSVEPGMIMNAVGHMMVGLGARIPEGNLPTLAVWRTTLEGMRAFRNMAAQEEGRLGKENTLFSDFAHTTTDGSARDHQTNTHATEEMGIIYFAACFAAEEEMLMPVEALLNELEAEKLHTSFEVARTIDSDFAFHPPIPSLHDDDFVEDDTASRFSIVLHRGLSGIDALQTATYGYLKLSQATPAATLRLHDYLDASGTTHPGMSEYGLVALKGKKNTSVQQTCDQDLTALTSSAQVHSSEGNPQAIALFGTSDAVKALTKKFSLWQGAFESTPGASDNRYAHFSGEEQKPSEQKTKEETVTNSL